MKSKSNTENTAGGGCSSHGLLGRGACLVTYDDEMGYCFPMGWNSECDGALECASPPVIFPNRAAAQKAIRISKLWNALCREQNRICNSDFNPDFAKNVRIVPVICA